MVPFSIIFVGEFCVTIYNLPLLHLLYMLQLVLDQVTDRCQVMHHTLRLLVCVWG